MIAARHYFCWFIRALGLAALALFVSCSDDAPAEKLDDNTTLADLSMAQIEEICSGVEAAGTVQCNGEMIDDSFDEAECIETTQGLQNDFGCLSATTYIENVVDATACERREFEPSCRGEDLCETYTAAECETRGEGVCQVRMGRRYDNDRGCLVDEAAYCTPSFPRGCDDALDQLEAPDGSCWQFSQICPSPESWTRTQNCTLVVEAASTCE